MNARGSRQLALARKYFTLTPGHGKNRIVYRETPFTGTAAPGDVVLVRLTVAGSQDWRYLMIEDPLPAGAETIADDRLYPLERRGGAGGGGARSTATTGPSSSRRPHGGRVEFWYLLKIVTPGGSGPCPRRSRRCTCRACRPRRRRSPSRSLHQSHEARSDRRRVLIAGWLLIGHALWLAIFSGLLQVPKELGLDADALRRARPDAGRRSRCAACRRFRRPGISTRPCLRRWMRGVAFKKTALAAALLFGAIRVAHRTAFRSAHRHRRPDRRAGALHAPDAPDPVLDFTLTIFWYVTDVSSGGRSD